MSADLVRQLEMNKPSINIQSVAATTTGSAVDITGYLGKLILFVPIGALTGVDGSNYLTFTVQEADTTTDSFTDVASASLDAQDSWDLIIDASGEADAGYYVGVSPSTGKNALKAIATETGSITSALIGAYFIFEKRHQPV